MYKTIKSLSKISLASLAILLAGQSQAMEKDNKYHYENFSKQHPIKALEENYSVSSEIKEQIDKNLKFPLVPGENRFPWLPGYVMKYNATRLCGSLLIKQCAQELNCNLVNAPDKQLYRTKWGELYIVEKLINEIKKPLSLQQTRQLHKVFKKTKFEDVNPGTVLNTKEGIVYIVDTEKGSFEKPLFGKLTYLGKLTVLPMDESAKAWLAQKIEKRKRKEIL